MNTTSMITKRFVTSVAQFVKIRVHEQAQIATIYARFQEAVLAAHDVDTLEPVRKPAPPESSESPSASLSDQKKCRAVKENNVLHLYPNREFHICLRLKMRLYREHRQMGLVVLSCSFSTSMKGSVRR